MTRILEPGDVGYETAHETTLPYARHDWRLDRFPAEYDDGTWWFKYRVVEYYEGPEMQVKVYHGRRYVGSMTEPAHARTIAWWIVEERCF